MKHFKKKPLIFIILGPPGSGKGTQAKLLAEKFGLEYIGSGDTLRKRQKIDDFTGKKLVKVMGKGELVPNLIIADIWVDEFRKLKKQSKINGIVLDSWNRTTIEVNLMDEALDWYEWGGNVKVILIDISRRESFNRLTKRRQCKNCGRLIPWIGEFKKLKKCDKCAGPFFVRCDDNIQSIKKRLEEFRQNTLPAINHYKKQNRLIKVNGEQSIEAVYGDILKALK